MVSAAQERQGESPALWLGTMASVPRRTQSVAAAPRRCSSEPRDVARSRWRSGTRLADVVNGARFGYDPVFLTRRGQQIAAVIGGVGLEQLLDEAEGLAGLRAAQPTSSPATARPRT